MNRAKFVAAAFVVLTVFGCSHLDSYWEMAKDRGISKDYIDILNKWTKEKTTYSQFETRVQIIATYKGKAFNVAYLNENARLYNLTEDEKKRREGMHAGFPSEFAEFFFYAYTPGKDANDFEKSNSLWSIFLLNAKGKRIEPLEIRKIEKITPVMEELYPYVNKYYGMCYNLKFPAFTEGNDAIHPMKLVFAGVLGRVELTWP